MKIAFYGSSLLSSYWNGAATYYRGLIKALAGRGHSVTFFEPDTFDRQRNRDIEPPSWCRVVVYPASAEGVKRVASSARLADVVVKTSGVGVYDDELLAAVMAAADAKAVRLWWDVDAPATLAHIRVDPSAPLRRILADLDAVLTYGGGADVVDEYTALGAKRCLGVYNALDPDTHFPVTSDRRFAADLAFLGNRLPDRERRVQEFFFEPARLAPESRFLLGGSGWDPPDLPDNVRWVGHVSSNDHNAFNATPRAVLNINRASMAHCGYSPATRIFEAAGAAACIISDAWPGIEIFLKPGEEILLARDGREVLSHLAGLTPDRARQIGAAARRRVLAEHTYARRAIQVERLLDDLVTEKREGLAA